jgi:hypothetical protein
MVVFRYKGRIVHRLPPFLIEQVFKELCPAHRYCKPAGMGFDHRLQVTRVRIACFCGGKLFRRKPDTSLLVPTIGMPKARACILGMYRNYLHPAVPVPDGGPSTKSEWDQALIRFAEISNEKDYWETSVKGALSYIISTESAPYMAELPEVIDPGDITLDSRVYQR